MQRALSTHLFVNHRLTTVWLDRIWEAGVPAVEIFCARQHLDYRNPAQINELKHWFRDSEMTVNSLHSPMFSDDCWGRTGPNAVVSIAEPEKMRRKASIDEIKRALEVAESVPFPYLVQHIGVSGEEYEDRKIDAIFSSLEELNVFAEQRGVEILLENIPNALSSAERLLLLLETTHLDLNFCFDIGHAHMMEGVEPAFRRMKERIRSTHIHDNDGEHDIHLFPGVAPEGTIDWSGAMKLLRSRDGQYPLLLELKEVNGMEQPLSVVRQVFDRLESA
ncbi:MAG: sugar phosphate isomerase/epimerase family protein [Bryobacteraceae bacterium]